MDSSIVDKDLAELACPDRGVGGSLGELASASGRLVFAADDEVYLDEMGTGAGGSGRQLGRHGRIGAYVAGGVSGDQVSQLGDVKPTRGQLQGGLRRLFHRDPQLPVPYLFTLFGDAPARGQKRLKRLGVCRRPALGQR